MDRLVHSDCGRVLMKVQYDSDPANLRALVTVDYGCNDIQLHPVVGSPHLFLVKSAPVRDILFSTFLIRTQNAYGV